jgi:CRP-like cAMP-binding protein
LIRLSRLVAGATLGWLLLGCASKKETDVRQSAARVARAVEVLREAPNPAKAEALRELAKVPCESPEACAARDACVTAYTTHVDALALTKAAKLQAAEGSGAEAAKVLGAAARKLSEANGKVIDCTDREAALRHLHKL